MPAARGLSGLSGLSDPGRPVVAEPAGAPEIIGPTAAAGPVTDLGRAIRASSVRGLTIMHGRRGRAWRSELATPSLKRPSGATPGARRPPPRASLLRCRCLCGVAVSVQYRSDVPTSLHTGRAAALMDSSFDAGRLVASRRR